MATLIAANYQSRSSGEYGFMSTLGITLKNSTLYTLKCRYKWNKNGTSSSNPYAMYLWRSTWTNSVVFTNTPSDYTTFITTWTSPSDAASYAWNIHNYANGQHNNGVADGAILSVDWYELWEGDATQFSLTDAIALSENKTANNFLTIQNGCTNTGYFSTTEPIEKLRSWMGYYYKTQSTTSYGDWSYTYASDYTSATRSRTATTYDHYSNGKVVQTGSTTQTESATVTNGSWSYNWTTTNNSTRSRTVTYTWGDGSTTTKTQTETGGARYIVLDNFSDGKSENSVHEFSAAGGSITARTVSHDYWPNISGTHIQTVVITGVTTTCTGFTCTTSGSTVTITAASKGTTESAANSATIVSSKSGFQTRQTGTCSQAANTVSYSYGLPQPTGIKWSSLVPAGGGSSTPSFSYIQVRTNTYTSGSSTTTNITSGATISYARAQIVQNSDPEFYWGGNSIYLYDNSNSGKTTVTRVTSGYPSGIPNNSGVAYRIQNTGSGPQPGLGGFCHAYPGAAGQTYICTFDAWVPAGRTITFATNGTGNETNRVWLTPNVGAGEWRTYSFLVTYGTTGTISTTFFFYLTGTAGTSSSPLTWWIANSKICKTSNVSATTPTINTSNGTVTLGSRGTTTGSTGVVDTYGAVVGTITMNGVSSKFVAAPSQHANAITSYEVPTFDMWWSSGAGNQTTPVPASGGNSAAPTYSVSQKANYTSGSQGDVTPSITSAVFSLESKDTAATASVNSSTGVVTFGSLGTTVQESGKKAIVKLTVISHGKTGTDTGWCYQQYNSRSLSSVYTVPFKPDSSWITDVTGSGSSTNWATVPASGGYLRSYAYANYTHTSGAPLNDQYISNSIEFSWSGSPSWITRHDSVGYYVAPNGGTTSTRTSTGTYSYTYGGVTKTCTETITQAGDAYTTTTEYSVDSVSPSTKSVTAAAGSFTLSWRQLKRTKYVWGVGGTTYSDWSVEANAGISSVSSNQTWATVGTKGTSDGNGYNSITISYSANQSFSSRSATITVTNGTNSKTCSLSQAGKPSTITVDATDFYFNVNNRNNTSMEASILEISSSTFSDAGSSYGISIDAQDWVYDQNYNIDGVYNGSVAFSGFDDDQFSNGNCKVFKLQMTDTLSGYGSMTDLSVNLEVRDSSGNSIVSHNTLDYSSFGGAATVDIPIVVCCDNSVSAIQISNYNFSDYSVTYSNPKAIVIRIPFDTYVGSYLQIFGDISFRISA